MMMMEMKRIMYNKSIELLVRHDMDLGSSVNRQQTHIIIIIQSGPKGYRVALTHMRQ